MSALPPKHGVSSHKTKRRPNIFLILISIIIGLVTAVFVTLQVLRSNMAAVLIESVPEAVVYINDERVGKTPYETEVTSGEIMLKLVPESFDTPLSPYQTKVNLTPGVKTIVRRKFGGESGDEGSGEIISFERVSTNKANVAVVTLPDGANVKLNNTPYGVAPLKISDVSPGNLSLEIEARGYAQRSFQVRAEKGHTVTVVADLEKTGDEGVAYDFTEENEEVLAAETKIEEETITITPTPTGFLRVRKEPTLNSEELTQLNPGETYPLISSQDEWFEIELESSVSGWISSEYATKSAEVNN